MLISCTYKKKSFPKSLLSVYHKPPAGLLCTENAVGSSKVYAYGYECVGEHEQVSIEVMRE